MKVRPKKWLGQNFMMDDEILRRIVDRGGIRIGDPILEVGPGTGALTDQLLDTGAAVTAVEKDRDLFERLCEKYAKDEMMNLICGDVLRISLNTLMDDAAGFAASRADDCVEDSDNRNSKGKGQISYKKVKVIANLPYNITKDFLSRALPLGSQCSTLLLMLQHEVAERLTAQDPGAADWRSINVLIQYYASDCRYLFRVDRRKYFPRPTVDGAVVEFRLRDTPKRPKVPNEEQFILLVKKAFLQRRKTLRNSLQPLASSSEISKALKSAGIDLDARAQNLTLGDFVRLAWALHEQGFTHNM